MSLLRKAFAGDPPYGERGLPVVTGREMAALDRIAIDERGIAGLELMESAGREIVEAMLERFPEMTDRSVVCLCGKGNNGGDGFVTARLLGERGVDVHAFHVCPADDYAGDAAVNLGRLHPDLLGDGTVPGAVDAVLAALDRGDFVVDALLGTGISGAPRAPYDALIAAVNACAARVIAVDLPSGLDAETGAIPGACIRADLTVTLALPKRGLLLPPGQDAVGELRVRPIGLPADLTEPVDGKPVYVTMERARSKMPGRPMSSHKGSAGRLLIVGGSVGFTGAVVLAASAAVRGGAGLVELAVGESIAGAVDQAIWESITRPLPDNGGLTEEAFDEILEAASLADAVALGPGIGNRHGTAELVRRLVDAVDRPLVLDADGLNAFAGRRGDLARHRSALILTPHPGEMGRLMDCPAREVQARRWELAGQLAEETGAVVVLKGANTVTATPGGGLRINSTGNPGMASAGMGDVLTGLTGALLAQGLEAANAAELAVYLHGLAGDIEWTNRRAPVAAGELVINIPEAFAALGGMRVR